MSESEDDNIMFPNNVFKFQNGNTTISARGPGINKSNLTGFSFRSNILTSTLNIPGHSQHRQFAHPQYDQRTLYNGKETSPMSIKSDLGPRNMHNSYYPRAMSMQRSLVNGRGGSPVSVRSINSSASVSAIDIVNALKYNNFNYKELCMIKHSYTKLLKIKARKRTEKKRNYQLFCRDRRRSGYDSGEQGSASSISNEDYDCRSVKTTTSFKSVIQRQYPHILDKSLLRTSNKETDRLYNDCSDIFKQSRTRTVAPVPLKPINSMKQSCIDNTIEVCNESNNQNRTLTLKDRFKNGFLLPSQRFNKSKSNVQLEKSINNAKVLPTTAVDKQSQIGTQIINNKNEIEEEQIFPEISIRGNGNLNSAQKRKRLLDEDNTIAARKRSRIDTDLRQNEKSTEENNLDFDNNIFTFKKPSLPIRKLNKTRKDDVREVLISKSSQPLTQNIKHISDKLPQVLEGLDSENNNQSVISQGDSNVSMKPSFIKRKLFTQRLDLLDNKNLSNDNLAAPSPQTKSNAYKEKNKTRKLVTSQSCLSRDVLDDENNVLDLIHKIIPPDQMNLTSPSNRRTNRSDGIPDDKYDVASIVSFCNSEEGSGTYTDEEMFNLDITIKKKPGNNRKKEANKPSQDIIKNCKVVLQNVAGSADDSVKGKSNLIKAMNRGAVSNSIKLFLDTDTESNIDIKNLTAQKQKSNVNQVKEDLNTNATYNTNLKPVTRKAGKAINNRPVADPRSFWDTDLESDIENTPKQKARINQVKEHKDAVVNTNLKPETKKGKGSMLTVRGLSNKVNNKTILNEAKNKSSTSPIAKGSKADVPKELKADKTKTKPNKNETNKPIESVLYTTKRSTRNSQKNLDHSCCDDTSNASKIKPNTITKSKTAKTSKTDKPKGNKKITPVKTKCAPKITVVKRKKKDQLSVLNNTQGSDSSLNTSRRSLRLITRIKQSKENIEPKRTRS